MTKIEEKDKVTILLNLLNERYNASHQMRERSLKFSLWILGFVVIAVGWLLLHGLSLTTYQRSILTVFVIIIGSFTFWFLHAIKLGFDRNRNVMISLETPLGCYEKDQFVTSESLFPPEYKEPKKRSLGYHFSTIYAWIIVAFLISIFMIWFGHDSSGMSNDEHRRNEQAQIQEPETMK